MPKQMLLFVILFAVFLILLVTIIQTAWLVPKFKTDTLPITGTYPWVKMWDGNLG